MFNYNIDAEVKQLIDKHPELWIKQNHKKGDLLNKIGRFATRNYYLETGIIKASIDNEDIGKEVIIGFISDAESILVYKSEKLNMPFLLNLEVINDAVIYSIGGEDWNELIEKNRIFNELFQQYTIRMVSKFIEQARINSYPRAKTRYEKSLENYPCLAKIKDEYVASFLGLDVRTISRVK